MTKRNIIVLSVLACLILVWDIYLNLQSDKTTTFNYLYNVGYSLIFFAGTFAGIYGAVKLSVKSSLGKALLFLGLGQSAYGIGLLIWSYYNLIAKVEIPYPSIADLFFIVFFIPLIAFGCIQLFKIVSSTITTKNLLEAFAIFVVSAIIVIGFINKPDFSHDLSLLNKVTNLAYPLGDTILLTLAYVTLRLGGGKINIGVRTLVLGLFVQVIADFLFTYRTIHNIYWNGDISDLSYTISATLISLSIFLLYNSFSSNETPQTLA